MFSDKNKEVIRTPVQHLNSPVFRFQYMQAAAMRNSHVLTSFNGDKVHLSQKNQNPHYCMVMSLGENISPEMYPSNNNNIT